MRRAETVWRGEATRSHVPCSLSNGSPHSSALRWAMLEISAQSLASARWGAPTVPPQ